MLINTSVFIENEIPKMHPASEEYLNYWTEMKRRCIEGHWQLGRWMPGPLYFYVNFWHILLTKSSSAKTKSIGRPLLRDIEWMLAYYWAEARGLGGFENTDFDKKGYNIRDHLWNTTSSEGKPLLEMNEAKNLMMLGSRNFGKSYFTAGAIIAHEWLFDGAKEYIHPQDPNFEQKSTTIVIGAGDAKYSGDLLKKVKFGMDKLPGGVEIGQKYFPCPFSKQYMGSWMPGKEVIATYKRKKGSNWEYAGSGSSMKHRTFKDDPYAANGIRASVMVMEEAGLFSNLKASHDASVDCMRSGLQKFGSCIYLGTGGDMDKGTVDASIMFNDPDTYDILAFKDTWEHKPKIGLFIPAYYALDKYKDKDGNTDIEAARAELEAKREDLRKGRSGAETIDSELQNRPLVPSEMFLVKRGNKFHIDTIRKRLQVIDTGKNYDLNHTRVELYHDPNKENGIWYRPLAHNEGNPLLDIFPSPQNIKNRDGCIVIYEHPIELDGKVPSDAYIIGVDPYAIDDPDGDSLAAVYVLKNSKYFAEIGHDNIVASFVGRPEDGRHIVNHNIEMLAQYYGNGTGMIYFENTRGNVKEYFEKNKKLRLLARQPDTVFAKSPSGKRTSTVVYGYSLDNKRLKEQALDYVRDWAWMERGVDENGRILRNYDYIWDRALLQEMAGFNMEANFDRCLIQGTKILTNSGYKNIEVVNTKDKVISADGKFHNVVDIKSSNHELITDLYYVGSNKPLKCTSDHPILTSLNNKRAGNNRWEFNKNSDYFPAGMLVPYRNFVLMPKRKLDSIDLTDDELYLLGWYIGDGHISKNNILRLTLSKRDKSVVNKLISIIEKSNTDVGTAAKSTCTVKDYGNYLRISKHSNSVCELLKKYGGTANNKKIDDHLFNHGNLFYLALGLIEAEGHLKLRPRQAIEVSMNSEDIVYKLRQILIDNGIWSTVRSVNSKQTKLTVPSDYVTKICQASSIYNYVSQIIRPRNVVIETSDGFWTPVKRVENYREKSIVYNLEVEDSHNYVSGGVISHNCMALCACVIGLEETHNQYIAQKTEKSTDILDFINSKFGKKKRPVYAKF